MASISATLAAALLDSCDLLAALLTDFLEGPPIAIEWGFLTRQRLPALLGIKLDAVTNPPG
jgi:hypothetical protein